MLLNLEIPNDKIRDLVERAAVRYWASVDSWERGPMVLVLHEREGKDAGVARVATEASFISALRKCAFYWPAVFGRIMEGTADGSDADVFVQLATLGEVVYG